MDNSTWIEYQNAASCCGYKGEFATGDECLKPEPKDCRTLLIDVMQTYLMWSMIVVVIITIVLIIITCAANCRMKSDCKN